ncbi:sigma-70 family RNA polymerase sigma factor [Streptomyces sp. NPDC002659]|uniref:sigma-70 family RNA polymerase sigma factor n=1 Tax=Streptomyces sp. NPDC002659 TaxID=3364656 RepID=UPI0036AB803F
MSATHQHSHVDWTDEQLAAPLRRGEAADEEVAELYGRHYTAVRGYAASCCRDPHTAEDLTSEAFTRTIDAVRRGGGPRGPWRPYLLSAVRRIAIDWAAMSRRTQPSDELDDQVDEELTGEEIALSREEDLLVVRSFQRLPERWQTVLWYTTVKGESAATVAARLGISESGVASLAERAREGLREAYLTVHADSGTTGDECGHYSAKLAALVRRKGRRPGKDLDRHLSGCARCSRALRDLTDLNTRLRVVLPGAVLLGGAAGYLATKAGAAKAALAGMAVPPVVPLPDPTMTAASSGHALALSKTTAVSVGASMSLAVAGYFLLAPYEIPQPAPRPPVTAIPSQTAVPPEDTGQRQLPAGPRITLRTAAGERCVEPVSAATAGGVRETDCDGGRDQVWVQLQFVGATVLLRNSVSGLCLRNSGTGGAPDVQARCDSGDARQMWRVEYSREHRSLVVVSASGTTYLA